MCRRIFCLAAAALAGAAVLAAPAAAQLVAITVSKDADLSFGKYALGGTSGTITMSTSGGRSATGGVLLLSGSPGTVAKFTVSGSPHAAYTISLPTSATLSGVSDSTKTLTVNSFASSIGSTGTLNSLGTQSFTVGATLNVPTGATAQDYTGSFPVFVDYQ